MSQNNEIAAPAMKAASAIGAGAGASIGAIAQQGASFLPTDAGGWAALAASLMALLYSGCLLGEWTWKKVLRPISVHMGWASKPKGTTFEVDGDGNVTRVDSA
jgi:hypothetical protein